MASRGNGAARNWIWLYVLLCVWWAPISAIQPLGDLPSFVIGVLSFLATLSIVELVKKDGGSNS